MPSSSDKRKGVALLSSDVDPEVLPMRLEGRLQVKEIDSNWKVWTLSLIRALTVQSGVNVLPHASEVLLFVAFLLRVDFLPLKTRTIGPLYYVLNYYYANI